MPMIWSLGMRFWFDAGVYLLSADILVGDLDAGSATNRVVIQGATNCTGQGTILDRQVGSGDTASIRLLVYGGY